MATTTKAKPKPAKPAKSATQQQEIARLRRDLAKKTVEMDALQGELAAAESALQGYKATIRPFLEELRQHRQSVINLWGVCGQNIYLHLFDLPVYEPIPDLDEGGNHE